MLTSKGVNRVFLVNVFLYIALSLLLSYIVPVELPAYGSILLSQALIAVPALVYCVWKKTAILEWIPYRKIKFSTGVLIVVCTYLLYPLLIVLNAFTLLFTESASLGVIQEIQGQSFLLKTLVMAVAPACIEEFVFRGVLFQTYRKSKKLAAIFLSSFLFGCMHMNFNQFLYTFVLGIYLAFIIEATGSIISSMLVHFVLNFTSVILSTFVTWFYDEAGIVPQQMASEGMLSGMEGIQFVSLLLALGFLGTIAIGTTVAAVAIYRYICIQNGRWEHVRQLFQKKGKTKERLVTLPLFIAIAAAVVVMVLRF